MASDTLLLGALALGAFVIYKSNISSGIGDIASGAGAAVKGLGGGISTAATGLGAGAGQVGYSAQDILQLATATAGEFGRQSAAIVELKGMLRQQELSREASREQKIDVGAFQIAADPLTKLQAEGEVFTGSEELKRLKIKEEFKTDVAQTITSLPAAFAQAGSSLWRYSPTGLLTSWITNISSIENTAATQQETQSQPKVEAIKPSGSVRTSTGSGGGSTSVRRLSSTGVPAGTYAVNVSGVPEINLSDADLSSLPQITTPKTIFGRIGKFLRGLGN